MYVEQIPKSIRYFGAVGASAVCLLIQYQFQALHQITGLGFFYPIPFLCAWYWGFGSAMLAAFLCAAGTLYLSFGTSFSFYASDPDVYIRLFVFVGMSALMAGIIRRGKKSERKFRETFQRLRLITDRLPSFVSYIDAEGKYQFVNQAYEKWFGMKARDLLGKTRGEFATAETTLVAEPNQARALRGEFVRYENLLEKPDGEKKHLEVELIPDRDPRTGTIRGAVIFGHDVTERRESLRIAEDSRQSIQNLFMEMPIGIATFDGPDQICTLANPTFLETLFARPRDFIGLSLRRSFPEGAEQGFSEILERVYRTGESATGVEAPVLIRETDGSERTIYINFAYQPRRDATGKIDGVLVVLYDVTAQYFAKRDIEKAVRVRDEFLSIASHELRTPVTGMKLQTQMMQRALAKGDESVFNPERVTKLVHQFDHGLDRINRLVGDMLDISRIQNGKLTLDRERTDLCLVIREILDRFSAQLTAAKVTIQFTAPPTLPFALDRFRFEQVFTNLITNAIRYAPGGPVRIELRPLAGHTEIIFQDSGPGIADADRERIFQRFERLVSADVISGLGIGLYIVREIVQSHGGAIHVEGEPGQGARFVIRLPDAEVQRSPEVTA